MTVWDTLISPISGEGCDQITECLYGKTDIIPISASSVSPHEASDPLDIDESSFAAFFRDGHIVISQY
jgi:hypothetical protein